MIAVSPVLLPVGKAAIGSLLLLMILVSPVEATFEIYSVDVNPVILNDDLDETFSYTFTARFNSYCAQNCDYLSEFYHLYGLGLSANENALGAGNLGTYIGSSFDVTAPDEYGLTTKSVVLGDWYGYWDPQSSLNPPPVMTATYSLQLKKSGLEALYQNNSDLVFWIRGLENENNFYGYDYFQVTIPIEREPIVRISGLDDIVIDTSASVSGYYQQEEDFCVYVSESPHTFTISVAVDNNQRDTLSLVPAAEGAEEAYLPYWVKFIPNPLSGSQSWTASPGDYPFTFTGSNNETCNSGSNMKVGVRVKTEDADQVPMYVYEDRMYITVKAQ